MNYRRNQRKKEIKNIKTKIDKIKKKLKTKLEEKRGINNRKIE